MVNQTIQFDRSDLVALERMLDNSQNIVVFPHTNADGDALGSTLAWVNILSRVCTRTVISVISPESIEKYLQWMPMIERIIIFSEQEEQAIRLIRDADIIFHLDHNQVSRLKNPSLIEVASSSSAKKIMIDHHLFPEKGFDVTISFPNISSTCELTYLLIKQMGWTQFIDSTVATLLTTGIVTDTGRFMYNCFSPGLYTHFSELLALGADYPRIIDQLSYHGTLRELQVKGYILHKKLEVYHELGIAIISLSRDEMERYEAKKGDTEGLVNLPLSIEGIYCSVFLREDEDQIKASLRSTGDFAVNELARLAFSGGGHLNAAGGEFKGRLEDAKIELMSCFRKMRSEEVKC